MYSFLDYYFGRSFKKMPISKVFLKLTWAFFIFCPNAIAQTNNVCKKYLDYATLSVNPNCWYNSDVTSNTIDMINRNGYPAEEYPVETEDGFTLSLYRIPTSNKTSGCTCRQAVFIQHGFQATSEVWTDVGDRSLAFYLSDHCYDVWLGNFRESPHTLKHRKYSRKDPQFWNHSWHELGLYDLPANLNFIKTKIGDQRKILYVGFSMGTTSSLVYQILKPSEAKENIQGVILMAPVAFFNHVKSPIYKTSAKFRRQLKVVAGALKLHGIYKDRLLQQAFFSMTCSKYPLIYPCTLLYYLLFGYDSENLLPKDMPLIFVYQTVSAAFKSLDHYLQVIEADEFQMYDYQSRNVEVYGQKKPPKYDLSKITLPTHLFYGSKDYLAVRQDVERLFEEISSVDKSMTELNYNHLSFMYSKDLKTNLYPMLLEKLESMKSENCD